MVLLMGLPTCGQERFRRKHTNISATGTNKRYRAEENIFRWKQPWFTHMVYSYFIRKYHFTKYHFTKYHFNSIHNASKIQRELNIKT